MLLLISDGLATVEFTYATSIPQLDEEPLRAMLLFLIITRDIAFAAVVEPEI
jgi:hypothetical protein